MTSNSTYIKIVKISDNAVIPQRASCSAAGLDLCSAYNYCVPANGKVLIKTDLQIKVPDGTYGRIAPRSSLALYHFISVGAGVIDSDYRGNVCVLLFNHSNVDFNINQGQIIAQLICEKIEYPKVMIQQSLNETERGNNGFGSTERNFFIFNKK